MNSLADILIKTVRELKAAGTIKRDSELATALGYSKGVVSEYLNNKKDVSEAFITKLFDYYKLDKSKLLEQSSFKEDRAKYTITKSNAKAIADPPTDILATEGLIPLPDGKFLMNTPLVQIKAYAGYLTSWGDEEYVSELPMHPIIVDKAHRGEYKSFEVSGDSMDDGSKKSIEDKSIVTGRNIGRHLWRDKLHLNKFSRFIIVSLDHSIVVKEITFHNTETGVITCHSLNPDKKQYGDFELSLDRVIQIFNVVQVTKKE